MILEELKAVVPSFVARVERPDRGGEWIAYLEEREQRRASAGRRGSGSTAPRRRRGDRPGRAAALGPGQRGGAARRAPVRGGRGLRGRDARRAPQPAARRARGDAGRAGRRARATAATAPAAASRRSATASRWCPTTAPSATSSATGCSPSSGRRSAPSWARACRDELDEAGVGDLYRAGLERSREEYARIVELGHPELAHYALALGYRIRYVLDMNAREAMHLIELRSGREGHPAYRAVAHALHAEIARVHPAVAATMTLRGPRHRAAARADPVRDPRAREAGRAGLTRRERNSRPPRTVRGAPTDQGGCPSGAA